MLHLGHKFSYSVFFLLFYYKQSFRIWNDQVLPGVFIPNPLRTIWSPTQNDNIYNSLIYKNIQRNANISNKFVIIQNK